MVLSKRGIKAKRLGGGRLLGIVGIGLGVVRGGGRGGGGTAMLCGRSSGAPTGFRGCFGGDANKMEFG